MTYLPPPKGQFDVEWATQNNRIIQQEISRLAPLATRVADLETGKQPLDGDLTAIAALTGTGYIRRTADDTWAISTTIPNTSVTGLGTMSTQNATAVAITGGTINGTSIGATTPSTGAFTTLSTTGAAVFGADSQSDAVRVSRSADQYLEQYSDGVGHILRGFSNTATAKAIIYDATTDSLNATPSGGSNSHIWRIRGTQYATLTTTAFNVTGDITASGLNSGQLQLVSGGTYQAGRIYSDANWGMILRALTVSPAQADFLFANSAGTERMRITSTGTSITGTLSTTGNMGAGVSSPVSRFESRPATSAGANVVAATLTNNSDTINTAVSLNFAPTNAPSVRFAQIRGLQESGTNVIGLSAYGAVGATLNLGWHVEGSGNVGIGTSSPSEKLTVAGNISASNLAGTTYTPTLFNASGLDAGASSAGTWQYMRVGNTVTVSGCPTIATTAANAQFEISLPIASNFTNIGDCAGTGIAVALSGTTGASVEAGITNDRAYVRYYNSGSGSGNVSIHFTYTIK